MCIIVSHRDPLLVAGLKLILLQTLLQVPLDQREDDTRRIGVLSLISNSRGFRRSTKSALTGNPTSQLRMTIIMYLAVAAPLNNRP